MGRTGAAQGTKIVALPRCWVKTSSSYVFLVMDEDGRIREDYQLTVQPLAA
jgi:hypothetical protein